MSGAGIDNAALSLLFQTNPSTRLVWAKSGLLRHRTSYNVRDAIELAVFLAIKTETGPKRAVRCWSNLKERILEDSNRSSLWLVVDAQLEDDALVSSTSMLVRTVSTAHAVHVIDLVPVIKEARSLFGDFVKPNAAPVAAVPVGDLEKLRQTKRADGRP